MLEICSEYSKLYYTNSCEVELYFFCLNLLFFMIEDFEVEAHVRQAAVYLRLTETLCSGPAVPKQASCKNSKFNFLLENSRECQSLFEWQRRDRASQKTACELSSTMAFHNNLILSVL